MHPFPSDLEIFKKRFVMLSTFNFGREGGGEWPESLTGRGLCVLVEEPERYLDSTLYPHRAFHINYVLQGLGQH